MCSENCCPALGGSLDDCRKFRITILEIVCRSNLLLGLVPFLGSRFAIFIPNNNNKFMNECNTTSRSVIKYSVTAVNYWYVYSGV